jgi:cell division protease FtsH
MTPQPPGAAPGATAPSPPWWRNPALWRWAIYAVVLLVINFVVANVFLPPTSTPRVSIPYTLFTQQVQAANVAEITASGDTIQGRFTQPVDYTASGSSQPPSVTLFATVQPTFSDPTLLPELEQQGVVVNATSLDQTTPGWLNLLFSFGPTILLIGGFLWLSRRAGSQLGSGGVFGIGRSQAKRYDAALDEGHRITFDDVAGIDEVKSELVQIVDFLKEPTKYTRLGGTVPKGVLLIGEPGTGKTLLARAVAGEANVPFFSMSASEFVELIVGVGASRVRDLFKQAREAAPAIVFIDELDAIGRARGGQVGFGSDSEQEQTLNQILTEMDGFSPTDTVIVLAATNRPDVLDQALLRPGRFDRRVVVQPPDKLGREAILKVHTRKVPLAADVNLAHVASSTPGLVGADLRNLVNESALLAAQRGEDAVHQKDFDDALETIALGPARPIMLSAEERERVAFHEGGHAILGLLLPGADPVGRVTIQPHGQALGVTYQQPEDDRHNYDEAYLRGRIVGAMGGRAAEEVVYGTRTTGAESDMQQATSVARQMVTRWGMSDRLGPITLAQRGDGQAGQADSAPANSPWRTYSEDTARLVDAEIRRVLDVSYAQAVQLLSEHRKELNALAAALLEHETLDADDLLRVTGLSPVRQVAVLPIPMPAAAFNGTRDPAQPS